MNTRAILRAPAVAWVVAAACGDPVEPALPAFSISPATQWSGGSITIRSQYFVGRDPLPVLMAGGDTLSATRQNDSTLVAQLPRGPSGSVPVTLARGARRDPLPSVQRVGYSGKRTVTPALDGELLATDSAGVPVVLGGSFTATQDREPVVRLKVVPGLAQVLTGLREPSNAFYGIAPSVTAGVFAVRDATDSLRFASLLTDAPTVLGSVPWIGTSATRQTSLLSDGMWLFTSSHWSWTMTETDSTEVVRLPTESPYGVFMSPRGDRTTLATVVSGAGGQVPVFDNATGTVAFTLPLSSTEVATFTPDGETLFAAGGNGASSDTLVMVDATSGSLVVPKVRLPDGFNAFGMAFRGAGGGQLLVAGANATTMAVLVYRAFTLELLGILPAPDSCGPTPVASPCFLGVLTVDDAHALAYIVIPGDPTPIWSFDLWSGP